MADCLTCKQPMAPGDDCGGDCTRCMANAGDPDCIAVMYERMTRAMLVLDSGVELPLLFNGEAFKINPSYAAENPPLKVFYNRNFKGHWPVGTSAIVIAANHEEAAQALEKELLDHGLGQVVPPNDMIEMEMKPQAFIVQNGNY